MNPQDYEVDIRPLSLADGGGFVAVAPELPGCRSDPPPVPWAPHHPDHPPPD